MVFKNLWLCPVQATFQVPHPLYITTLCGIEMIQGLANHGERERALALSTGVVATPHSEGIDLENCCGVLIHKFI